MSRCVASDRPMKSSASPAMSAAALKCPSAPSRSPRAASAAPAWTRTQKSPGQQARFAATRAPGLLGKTRLGQRHSNVSIERGPLLRIDPAESLAHHDRLSSETSAAKVEDKVHEPVRKQLRGLGLLAQRDCQIPGTARKPARCLGDQAGTHRKFRRLRGLRRHRRAWSPARWADAAAQDAGWRRPVHSTRPGYSLAPGPGDA